MKIFAGRNIITMLRKTGFTEHFNVLAFNLQKIFYYLEASSIATATATVIPTIGLLPAPIKPIIST